MVKTVHFCFLFLLGNLLYSQNTVKKYSIRTVAFYNLENLFDTINNPKINDEASPIMQLKGNKSEVYWDKIDKLGFAISQIGKERTGSSPTIIGVCEVENKEVLRDLVNSKHLRQSKYEILHYDSSSLRGIDVALLYQPLYFTPIHHEVFDPNIYRDGKKIYTRDQLLVSGFLDGELLHFIVNHWPSRRGGENRTRKLREKAAFQNVKILEQLFRKDSLAKILVLGDFNDNPTNSSLKKVLKTKGQKEKLTATAIFNPYESLYRKGYNSSGYRDNVNLFDQILLSAPLIISPKEKEYKTYKLFRAKIFNKAYLTTQNGQYKGYPFRSFSYGNYIGGYSDHYPVYVYLIKESH